MTIEKDNIYNIDCIEGMKMIPDNSIDCIICDLPYGTTACAWDSIIPFDKLWAEYKRIRKPNAPILLFGSEPFSTMLRMSNLKEWRYDWIWQKNNATGFLHAKNAPRKDYEIISAFCQYGFGHVSTMGEKRMPYNPQGLAKLDKPILCKARDNKYFEGFSGARFTKDSVTEYTNYPTTHLNFDLESNGFHPTQKPLDLLRYLVLTYSNEGDTILDNTCGSGTTCVAAYKEKRHFIGFELNKEYYDKALQRINRERQQLTLF